MNHRSITILIGALIIAAVVGSVIYIESPTPHHQPTLTTSTSNSDLLRRATTSILESLPRPHVGPPPAAADPLLISWTLASLTEVVAPGDTQEISVNFISSRNLRRASVVISPELALFVPAESPLIE